MLSITDNETSGSGEPLLTGGRPRSIRTTRYHEGLQPIQGPSPESFYDNLNADREILSQANLSVMF